MHRPLQRCASRVQWRCNWKRWRSLADGQKAVLTACVPEDQLTGGTMVASTASRHYLWHRNLRQH